MRPSRLETRTSNDHKLFYLAAAGYSTAAEPSHAASGALGLIVLIASGRRFQVLGKSGLEPIGTWGKPPPDSAITVAQLGPNEAMGWIVTWGAAGMGGAVVEGRTYYGNIGGQIVNLGTFQTSYDQPADDRAEIDVTTSIRPLAQTSDRFYPLQIHVSGTAAGLAIDRSFKVSTGASDRYAISKELSDDMIGCPVGCENIK